MMINKMRIKRIIGLRKTTLGLIVLAACTLLLQPGCSGTKPSRFYVLSPMPPGETPANQELSIGIGPLKFPDYLLRPQIVTQAKANQLEYAEYDRWAEPLDDNFIRVLAGNLARLIPTDQVHIYPWLEILRVDFQLLLQVVRFGHTENGQIELAVFWSVLDDTKRKHLLQRRSTFSRPAPAADPTDYAALAAGMSELIGEFSREVAQALQNIRRQ